MVGLQEVDTFHGNVVLIPQGIRSKLGCIDGEFEHAFADIDYGFRAKSIGVKMACVTAPLAVGTANENQQNLYGWRIPFSNFGSVFSRKNLPLSSTVRFARRHGGLLWPLYLLWIYARTCFPTNVSREKTLSRTMKPEQ
jgi:hypothetical protein